MARKFEYRGQLNGADNPVAIHVPIANSQTVSVGDAVSMQAFASGGGCMRSTAGDEVLGIVRGIVNDDGIDLDNASSDTYDGTWTSSSKQYAAAADNMTDKNVKAIVVVDKWAVWYNDAAGDLAAADVLKYFDLDDHDQIADQNGDDDKGAFILLKRDPESTGDNSEGLWVIAESELDPYAQQS